MAQLDGTVAVVTGGAGGIGAATTSLLASRGASVVVADIDGEGARRQADVIVAAGGQALGVQVDIADESSVAEMVQATVGEFGTLNVLHNNATSRRFPASSDVQVHEADPALWEEILRVNIMGTMLCTKHALRVMLRSGRGSIIITSSNAGLTGALGHPAYGSSKGALATFTKYVATEYGKDGIRCNAISPGFIVTPHSASVYSAGDLQDMMLRHHLTNRLGVPDDVAHMVAFLASDESSYVTGQVICVDGGSSAHQPYYADELLASGGKRAWVRGGRDA